jgi:hypothetical protein
VLTWITLLAALPALFAAVKELVLQMEQPSAPGAAKKEAVMNVLQAALSAINSAGIALPVTTVLGIASAMVDAVVAAYNLLGVFRHTPAPAPLPPPPGA